MSIGLKFVASSTAFKSACIEPRVTASRAAIIECHSHGQRIAPQPGPRRAAAGRHPRLPTELHWQRMP
jgi:hypothetical protein